MLRTLAILLLAWTVMLGGGVEVYGQAKSATSSGSAKKVTRTPPKKATTKPAAASHSLTASRDRKRLQGSAHPRGKTKAAAGRVSKASKPGRIVGKPAPRHYAPTSHARAKQKPGTGHRQAGKRVAAAHRTAKPAARAVSSRYAKRVRPGTPGDRYRSTRYGRVSRYGRPFSVLPPEPAPIDDAAPRILSLYHVHTHEEITVTFWRDGQFQQSELDRLNDFLADNRNGTHVQMDPELFNVLWRVRYRLRSSAPYRVLSAYRSPETNSWLASVSRGVASDSLHMRGQAMDVTLPGRTAGQIRAAARTLGLGGVGYYPRSGFVHLDTGPVRYW